MNDLKTILTQNTIDTSSLVHLADTRRGAMFRLTVPGEKAESLWEQLRQLTPQTVMWPVLLGSDEEWEILQRNVFGPRWRPETDIEAMVQAGRTLDIEAWRQRHEQDEASAPDYDDEWESVESGEWPESNCPNDLLTVDSDMAKCVYHDEVFVALAPARHSWEVPAVLAFGDWNSCPSPATHVGLWKYWYDTYGAEVVTVTHAVVEMKIPRPPSTREDALKLAWEHYFYCDDIVTQGSGTLENLAATLVDAKFWYFWWD